MKSEPGVLFHRHSREPGGHLGGSILESKLTADGELPLAAQSAGSSPEIDQDCGILGSDKTGTETTTEGVKADMRGLTWMLATSR